MTYPALSRIVVWIIIPLAAIGGFGYERLRHSLPMVSGMLTVKGITASVTIARDVHGVPSIVSASDDDAFFAIGYAQGQDRLWQLEVQRRMAYGQLSEVFGSDSVELDTWMRTLGFRQLARESWNHLDQRARKSLLAYAAGVNAARSARRLLPVEFQLLGVDPEPWTPFDSLAVVKLFALNLGGNFQSEIRRLISAGRISPDKLGLLFPEYSSVPASAVASPGLDQAFSGLLDIQKSIETGLSIGGQYVGSNAWVVSGEFTDTGKPMLANDPHMELQIPSAWYAVRAKGASLDISGMTLVGLPVVVSGRNGRIAWGVTSMMADTQDLFFEQPNERDPLKYLRDGKWASFDVSEERIAVRAAFPTWLHGALKPVTIRVRKSAHGPIITDVISVLKRPVALRWPALDGDDTSYQAFFDLNYAGDWKQFQDALAQLVAPALNVLYADDAGNIGFMGAGRIPIRQAGRDGLMPQDGWTERSDWVGFIPPADMPRVFNPPEGFIVNANNKMVADDYPYLISHEWAPPARAARITQLLRARLGAQGPRIDTDYIRRMQGDTLDLDDIDLLPVLKAYRPTTPRQAEAVERLKSWNGDATKESSAAAIFHAWSRQLGSLLIDRAFASDWPRRRELPYLRWLEDNVTGARMANALNPGAGWCGQGGEDVENSCVAILGNALDAGLHELEKLTGSTNMNDWTWGKVHKVIYEHHPFSEVKGMERFFERSEGAGGSRNSINVAPSEYEYQRGYSQHFGSGFRQIITLGKDNSRQLYMNSTGQSGNVMDAHYDDMVRPFNDVLLYAMPRDRDIEAANILTLKPSRP